MLEEIEERLKKLEPFYVKSFLYDIFSWRELENILNLRPFNNLLRFNVSKGSFEENYTWREEAWLTDINSVPPSSMKKILNDRMIYLTDASRINHKVNNICSELDKIIGWPTDAHIYIDLSLSKKGFGIHCDASHNLILQIEGSSNAKIWNQKSFDKSKIAVSSLPENPIVDVDMNPGDIIFVPAYQYHSVTSITNRLSISFPSEVNNFLPPQERTWIKLID